MQADQPSPRLVIPLPGASTTPRRRASIPPELRALGADLARMALTHARLARPGLLLSAALMLTTFLVCTVANAAGLTLPIATYVFRAGLWTLVASTAVALGAAGLRACTADWGWRVPSRAAPPSVRASEGWQTVFEDA